VETQDEPLYDILRRENGQWVLCSFRVSRDQAKAELPQEVFDRLPPELSTEVKLQGKTYWIKPITAAAFAGGSRRSTPRRLART
jgi:hypothetical protein